MRIDIIHPQELGPAETTRWRALALARRELWGPYFTPDYAIAIGAQREDARVAILEDGGEVKGFFTAQCGTGRAAMPLGAPLSDYQGLIGPADLAVSTQDLCRALRVGRIDFSHMLADQAAFAPHHQGMDESFVAPVAQGGGAYLASLKARRAESVRTQDKKRRKLEREEGAPVFTAMSRNRAHFEQVLDWKDRQLARTGCPPTFATPWVRRFVEALWNSESEDFGGAFFTWEVNGKLVAGNFALRSRRVLHDWLIAHDTAYDRASPGLLLGRDMCVWAGDNGFEEVDFGLGDTQYKRLLSLATRPLAWGYAAPLTFAGMVRGMEYGVRRWVEGLPIGSFAELPGKAMRRMDVNRGLGSGLGGTVATLKRAPTVLRLAVNANRSTQIRRSAQS
jgi:CelD/BcsL family acetyltransferase involved in cellulose biosynthesis